MDANVSKMNMKMVETKKRRVNFRLLTFKLKGANVAMAMETTLIRQQVKPVPVLYVFQQLFCPVHRTLLIHQ